MAARFSGRDPRTGEPMWGAGFATSKGIEPRWTGKVALIPDQLDWPLRWKGSKKAKAEGRPSRIFVNSTSDLFHERLSDEDIDKVFAVMALAPQHTFQVLTKRADRMRAYMLERWQGTPAQSVDLAGEKFNIPAGGETGRHSRIEEACEPIIDSLGLADTENDALWDANGSLKIKQFAWPLPNVWLGVSVENQEYADERIPHLLNTPAAKRFISAEPLLGPVNACRYLNPAMEFLYQEASGVIIDRRLDLVITGGESGPDARPAHPDWFRSLRDQCAAAGVPFFFKQWGEWAPRSHLTADQSFGSKAHRIEGESPNDCWGYFVGKKVAGHLLDGREHREMPG